MVCVYLSAEEAQEYKGRPILCFFLGKEQCIINLFFNFFPNLTSLLFNFFVGQEILIFIASLILLQTKCRRKQIEVSELFLRSKGEHEDQSANFIFNLSTLEYIIKYICFDPGQPIPG